MQEFLDLELGELSDVATTKERFEDIETRLSAIEGHLGKSVGVRKLTSFWPKTLTEWVQVIGVVVGILVATCGATLYLGSLMVDRRVQSALLPVQNSVNQINGDVREIKGTLSVLQIQIAATKYSNVPPPELKVHRDELKAIRTTLVNADKSAPNYWPVSFQVINLLSMAVSYIHNPNATESTVDNASGVRVVKNGDVVVLKHEISNSVFEGSVIRFDPSVRLQNVTFKNCVFIFPVTGPSPAKPLQDIGNALLIASDISEVSMSTS